MILRPFNINDAETILSWCKDKHAFRLWSADRYKEFPAQPMEMQKQYDGDNMFPLTAVIGERIVGHILLRFPLEDKSVIRFGFVIVDDSKRGEGYGKQMLHLAIDYAQQELGAHKITLGVFCNNLPALKCYQSVGFKITGEDSYMIDGEKWKGYEMKYGDFDRIYTEGYNNKSYAGRVIEPGKVYELSYPECSCPKVKCGLRNHPQQCECSRQSILYILSQLEPDSHFEVRIENTILRGSDRCTFRTTRHEGY